MRKVLVLLLAFSLFPVAVMAQSLTERQLNKINAKEALRFPQPCDIEQKVIDTAKKVYEKIGRILPLSIIMPWFCLSESATTAECGFLNPHKLNCDFRKR